MSRSALGTTAPVRRRQYQSPIAFDANGHPIVAQRIGKLWSLCTPDGGFARG
jgi:hypothetical protein